MNEKEYLENIQRILQDELSLPVSCIEPNQAIRDMGIDSISLMALLVHLENQFHVSLDELFVQYDESLSFADIVALIEQNRNVEQGSLK